MMPIPLRAAVSVAMAIVQVAACAPGEGAGGAIRVNLLGYRPDAPRVGVVCMRSGEPPQSFRVEDAETGAVTAGPLPVRLAGGIGPCVSTARLDFAPVVAPGRYRLRAGDLVSPDFEVGPHVWDGVADSMLYYLRQQRSLYNPVLGDSVHHRTDGILVDHSRAGEFIDVAGGWADAADYLQYATTSAVTTFHLLKAWREAPALFADRFDRAGEPGANGEPDVLDEARWGLEWLLRMYPEPDLLLHQIGDDRDHAFLDLPTTDSSDYGWGRGGPRPVYPCTGRPQGLLEHANRSDGLASAAGKFAAAFALGSQVFRTRDAAFADTLEARARSVFALGRAHPGVCQTAPARSPYFYEEANWADDMELAAALLHALTGEPAYLRDAFDHAGREPVTPWMGADTARHYEWFPWHNHGHHELWRTTRTQAMRDSLATWYARGLDAVAARADNGFLAGIPFIWCSNDLVVAVATQALHWRWMTADSSRRDMEQAAFDWIFGANPWGASFVIGLPTGDDSPQDPHSVMAQQLGLATQTGGLVDGPVYRSIFENLQYVTLTEADEYAPWNGGAIVYHDDWGDYSTNEPIQDGTGAAIYLAAALARR